MKEKETKMAWALIVNRSCLLQQARQAANSLPTPGGEQIQELNYHRCDTSAALNTMRPDPSFCLSFPKQTIFLLLIPAIVLAIASRFAPEFGYFKYDVSPLNNECKSRKKWFE